MKPDDYKAAWQGQTAQTRLVIDAELLLNEVRRNQASFAAMIFWRDVREVGVSLVMVPVWLYVGVKQSLPWTWYLMVPAILWVGGYMLVDRWRHHRHQPGPGEPLRRLVAGSLAQVEHQIWLLRRVFWWYLLPLLLPMLAFIVQATGREWARAGGWWQAVALAGVLGIIAIVVVPIAWLNQYTVRAGLEPRRQELATLLASLADEAPEPS